MIIAAQEIYTGADKLSPGWVEIADARVIDFGQGRTNADETFDGAIVPGFVDVHCHGSGGFGFDTQPTLAAEYLHARGTTTVLASLVTESVATLNEQIAQLADEIRTGRIAGVHLEGPCISPLKRGAHNPTLLQDPGVLEEIELDLVRMVTIAPELSGALDQISRLVNSGITVAIGHSDADARVAKAAFDSGATVVTHLFNAMRPVNHREPGIIEAALLDQRAFVELIADGIHLSDETVSLVHNSKPDRWMAVSDASAGAGLDNFDFTIGGLSAHVRDGAARLDDGTLAGSAATMDQIFARLVRQFGIDVAVQATSTRPARALKLQAGVIAKNRDANLVLWKDGLQRVMRKGEWISKSS